MPVWHFRASLQFNHWHSIRLAAAGQMTQNCVNFAKWLTIIMPEKLKEHTYTTKDFSCFVYFFYDYIVSIGNKNALWNSILVLPVCWSSNSMSDVIGLPLDCRTLTRFSVLNHFVFNSFSYGSVRQIRLALAGSFACTKHFVSYRNHISYHIILNF